MKRWLRGLAALAALASLPWVVPPVYDFPAPTAFHGATVHNPYAGVRGPWRRVAMHLHARAWLGLTDGAQAREDVLASYRDAGFEAVALTDYMRIEDRLGDVRGYEHGYNRDKTHQLLLGATSVNWFDQPIGTLNGKQFTLDWLRSSAPFIALTHPYLSGAYSPDELKVLGGYDALELASHTNTWGAAWDVALASGHRVWGVGGDDSHSPTQTGYAWTMVSAPSAAEAEVVGALRSGHAYVLRTETPGVFDALALRSLEVEGERVKLVLEQPVDSIRCFAQLEARETFENVAEAECVLRPTDGYLRMEARRGDTLAFFNPVTRELGVTPVRIAWAPSLAWWSGWLLGVVATAWAFRRSRRQRED